MILRRLILLLLAVLTFGLGMAQTGAPQPRILLLLDMSSSMIQPWDAGKQKAKVADEIILRLMDSVYSVNPDVEFSLRVFGHQSVVEDNNCRDTRNEVPFRKDNRLQMEYRLDDIKPLGVTSIAYALEQAADNDLVDVAHNAYSIILITDGGESCGGDICEVMKKLSLSKVFFRPYIVNLEASPALKASYACMGDYLEVTHNADIPATVGKIVEAFRPIIKLTTAEYTKIKEVAAKTPTVLGVTIPDVKIADTTKTEVVVAISHMAPLAAAAVRVLRAIPVTDPPVSLGVPRYTAIEDAGEPEKPAGITIDGLHPANARRMPVSTPVLARATPTRVSSFEPKIVEEFERPAPLKIARMTVSPPVTLNIILPNSSWVHTPRVPPTFTPVIREERPEPVAISKLTPTALRTRGIIFVLDEKSSQLKLRRVPPMPPLKFDDNLKTMPASADGTSGEYTIVTEDTTETTVEVYFTDGKGKFFYTTPQVLLTDPKTGKLMHRFYRMTDADGNPDPQTGIKPGVYNFGFGSLSNVKEKNVPITANKKNKIFITVRPASLSFEYVGDTKRPVKEFFAIVTQRNVPNGKVVRQECSEKKEYEPGNYHVEIQTFPIDIRNLDLEFDERVIAIPQPGFVKFTAQPGMNSVTLYQQLGDKFLSFYTLNLNSPAADHLRIQPGKYQAHYHVGPGGSHASEKVIEFAVLSNKETEVTLK